MSTQVKNRKRTEVKSLIFLLKCRGVKVGYKMVENIQVRLKITALTVHGEREKRQHSSVIINPLIYERGIFKTQRTV